MKSQITCSTERAALDFIANLESRGYAETHVDPIAQGRYRKTFGGGVYIIEWNETKEHEAEALIYEAETLRTFCYRKSLAGRCRNEGCRRKVASPAHGLCRPCYDRMRALLQRLGMDAPRKVAA